jgi:acid phosphatase type 7
MRRTVWAGLLLFVFSMVSVAQQSASNADAPPALKITKGPTVEYAGSTSATVAWSTNVSGATIVHYGTEPSDLSQKAMAPWGALTHRVTLKHLQPNTTYFFKVDSTESGKAGSSDIQKFETKDSNATASR